MRRYFALILLLTLLLPCLVVPASATTQGVIDAIEDLQAGLGESQRDIVDLLTSIDDWIYQCLVELQDISTTLYTSIYENYCVPMLSRLKVVTDFFGIKSYTIPYYKIVSVSTGGFRTQLYYSGSGTLLEYFFAEQTNSLLEGLATVMNVVYDFLIGDTTVSDSIQDEVDADSTEASEMLDVMDDVTKPDIGELEDLSDISDYVNAGDVSVLAACLSPFFQSAIFLPCIMLSLIFMLVAYVLYGKR